MSLKMQLENQFGEKSENYILPGVFFSGATAPVNGTTADNLAPKGALYIAEDTGVLYQNTGTLSASVWQVVPSGTAAVLATVLTGFVAGAGVVANTDTVLQGINKLAGSVADLKNGKLTPASETVAAAGALSTTVPESLINNASGGSIAVTLAAPSSQDGQLKLIKLGTATNPATLAMTNIKGPGFSTLLGTTTITFTATGDCAILMAVGAKWQLIGGNAVVS